MERGRPLAPKGGGEYLSTGGGGEIAAAATPSTGERSHLLQPSTFIVEKRVPIRKGGGVARAVTARG